MYRFCFVFALLLTAFPATALPGIESRPVAAGGSHSLWIAADGSLRSAGDNSNGQLGRPSGTNLRVGSASDWALVAAGPSSSFAIKQDGSLWAWGEDAYGQLGLGGGPSRTTPIRVGTDSDWVAVSSTRTTLALKADGSLWAWGANDYGTFGNGTTHAGSSVPARIGADSDWSAIATGFTSSYALKSDGTLWSWGSNQLAQLGRPAGAGSNVPGVVTGLPPARMLAAGLSHAYAIAQNGTLWAWGLGGMLGTDSPDNREAPQQVGADRDWTAVGSGAFFGLAIKADGGLWHWGPGITPLDGSSYQPARVNSAVAWASLGPGWDHVMLRAVDGSTGGLGANWAGQLGVPGGQGLDLLYESKIIVEPGKVAPTFEFRDANHTFEGEEAVFTATRTAGGPPVGGAMTFLAGTTPMAGCANLPLVNGVARCAIATLPRGDYLIRAMYLGDAATNPSLTSGLTHLVGSIELRVQKTGTGLGTVVSNPPLIDCGPTCVGLMRRNNVHQLTFTANEGSRLGATAGCQPSGPNSCSVQTSEPEITVTVEFISLGRRLLIVNPGGGTVTGSTSCAAQYCSSYVEDGGTQSLFAEALPGWRFTGWSGDCTGPTCQLTMDGDKTVTANFAPILTLTKSGTGEGSVVSLPAGIDCGNSCAIDFPWGSTVSFTATAAPGSRFVGWSGPCFGLGTCTFQHNAPRTLRATFTHVSSARAKPYDFNGDGRADITWRDRPEANPGWAIWLMSGFAASNSALILEAGAGWSINDATADFNGDGRADLLLAHADGSVAMWMMDGMNVIGSAMLLGPGTGWESVRTPDLNGDGFSDILLRHADGSIAAWLMDGTVRTASRLLAGPGFGWRVGHADDFDGDGRDDLQLFHQVDGSVALWLMNGLAVKSSSLLLGPGTWEVRGVGDFNGDSRADVLWRDSATGDTAIWLLDGAFATASAVIYGGDPGWRASVARDFDGDGRADLLWRHDDGRVGIWTMNGLVSTSSALLYGGGGWSVDSLRDFDGDGRMDILWVDSAGQVAIWTMNGTTVTGSALIYGGGGWAIGPSTPE